MGTFLDQARQTQQDKQNKAKDKDPADLSGSKDPWATGNGAGGSGGDASNSAGGNDGESAGENEHQEQPKPQKPTAPPTRTPALRRGRPKGPDRTRLSTRILPELNRKLTKAVEETGKNPQTIVEEALAAYFRRLKIEDPGEEADVA